MKKTIFNNTDNLITLHTTHHNTDQPAHKTQAKKTIHTQTVQQHLLTIPDSNIFNRPPPDIDKTETDLPRRTWRLLAQLRANKSSFLLSPYRFYHPSFSNLPSVPGGRAQYLWFIQLPTHSDLIGPGFTQVKPSSAEAAALLDLWTVAHAGAQ